jgi:hypothetical protein
VQAKVLATQRLLLPKGAFLDCTLETAIDSSLPGMTTCITATDTFGADGSVVLLERGTKLVGETRGDCHLYLNHLGQADQQLSREPRALPRLVIHRRPASLFDYRFEDFELVGSAPHESITAPIAV